MYRLCSHSNKCSVILSCPVLNCHGIVINMGAICLKLLAPRGIAVVQSNLRLTKEGYEHPTKSLKKVTMAIDLLKKPESHVKLEPIDPIEDVQNIHQQSQTACFQCRGFSP